MQHFTKATTVTFANQTNEYLPNTLKLTVAVLNWPFLSIDNSLALVLDASNPNQATQSCNIASETNEAGSLQWVQITINGQAMYPFCSLPVFARKASKFR